MASYARSFAGNLSLLALFLVGMLVESAMVMAAHEAPSPAPVAGSSPGMLLPSLFGVVGSLLVFLLSHLL